MGEPLQCFHSQLSVHHCEFVLWKNAAVHRQHRTKTSGRKRPDFGAIASAWRLRGNRALNFSANCTRPVRGKILLARNYLATACPGHRSRLQRKDCGQEHEKCGYSTPHTVETMSGKMNAN